MMPGRLNPGHPSRVDTPKTLTNSPRHGCPLDPPVGVTVHQQNNQRRERTHAGARMSHQNKHVQPHSSKSSFKGRTMLSFAHGIGQSRNPASPEQTGGFIDEGANRI